MSKTPIDQNFDRSLLELLKIVSYHPEHFRSGLCQWIDALEIHRIISRKEARKLLEYVKNNRPSMFSHINAFYHKMYGSLFYWEKGILSYRLKWLDKHIKIQKQLNSKILW